MVGDSAIKDGLMIEEIEIDARETHYRVNP